MSRRRYRCGEGAGGGLLGSFGQPFEFVVGHVQSRSRTPPKSKFWQMQAKRRKNRKNKAGPPVVLHVEVLQHYIQPCSFVW